MRILLKRPTDSTSVKQAPPISRVRARVRLFPLGLTESPYAARQSCTARIVKMHVSRNWNAPSSGRLGTRMCTKGGSGNIETADTTIPLKTLNANEQESPFFVIADGMMSREKKLRERKSYHLERCRYSALPATFR